MKREELHDLILGVAVVALAYAFYQHRKAVTAAKISQSDQAAIDTAIGTGPGDPAVFVPAPIPVTGNASTGYSADVPSGGWLSNLESMLTGAI